MQQIINLLISLNFWAIAGSVASVFAVITAVLVWRHQLKRDKNLPSRENISEIEDLTSQLINNGQRLARKAYQNSIEKSEVTENFNSLSWKIREKLNELCNREHRNAAVVAAAEDFYRELSHSINSKIIKTDSIVSALKRLRKALL